MFNVLMNFRMKKKVLNNVNLDEIEKIKKLLKWVRFGSKKNRRNKFDKVLVGRLILRQIRPVFLKRFEDLLVLKQIKASEDVNDRLITPFTIMRTLHGIIRIVRIKFYRMSLLTVADFKNVKIFKDLLKISRSLQYRLCNFKKKDYAKYKKKYRKFFYNLYKDGLNFRKVKIKAKVSLLLAFLSKIIKLLNVAKYLLNNIKIKKFSKAVGRLFEDQTYRLVEGRVKEIVFDIGWEPDWIGLNRSKEKTYKRPFRLMLYENVKKFYNFKKYESAWLFTRKLRQVKKKLTLEKYMKYFEVNLKILVYRSGLIPSYELAESLVQKAKVCVNGKIIDNVLHAIENFDIISFDSVERGRLKYKFLQYMETIFYSQIVNTVGLKLRFLEYNYLIFGFMYLSMFYSLRRTPMLNFKFPGKLRERILGWGKYQTIFSRLKKIE